MNGTAARGRVKNNGTGRNSARTFPSIPASMQPGRARLRLPGRVQKEEREHDKEVEGFEGSARVLYLPCKWPLGTGTRPKLRLLMNLKSRKLVPGTRE